MSRIVLPDSIKIEDAGKITPHSRIARHWRNLVTSLEKFTKAKAFNQKVQSDPREFIKYFGFSGVEFGNWMSQEDRLEFLFGAAHAFEVLRKFFKVPAKSIGLGGKLAIAFGGRGLGFALAHYEPDPQHPIINITKPNGAMGALFHEYAHAVDHLSFFHIYRKDRSIANVGFCSGGHTTTKRIDPKRAERNDLIGLAETIVANFYYEKSGDRRKWLSDFMKSSEGTSDYWASRLEVWARCSEVYCSLLAQKVKQENKMLVKHKYEKHYYPPVNVIKPLFGDFSNYYKVGIKFLNGGSPTVISSLNLPGEAKKTTRKSKSTKKKTTKKVSSQKFDPNKTSFPKRKGSSLKKGDIVLPAKAYNDISTSEALRVKKIKANSTTFEKYEDEKGITELNIPHKAKASYNIFDQSDEAQTTYFYVLPKSEAQKSVIGNEDEIEAELDDKKYRIRKQDLILKGNSNEGYYWETTKGYYIDELTYLYDGKPNKQDILPKSKSKAIAMREELFAHFGEKGLADQYCTLLRRKDFDIQTLAKPKKKPTKANSEVKKLSDKPKKRRTRKSSKKTTQSSKKKVRLTFLDRMFGVKS